MIIEHPNAWRQKTDDVTSYFTAGRRISKQDITTIANPNAVARIPCVNACGQYRNSIIRFPAEGMDTAETMPLA